MNDSGNICAGLKSISRCSKLSSLKLGICSNITDEGLKLVGSTCSMLKELDLYRFVTFHLCAEYDITVGNVYYLINEFFINPLIWEHCQQIICSV